MKLLTKQQCTIHATASAYLLSLNTERLVQREPFIMAGGDVLNIKDKFTSTDNGKGAAATHGINLDDGWYQQYEGKVLATHETGQPAVYILFSAFEIRNGRSAVSDFIKELGAYLYIGYVEISGTLFSCRGRSSTNVAPCKTVQRFYINEQTSFNF